MGEIDTKSIESVQASIFLFDDKTDQIRSRPTCNYQSEKEDIEILLKDMKSHPDAKNSAQKQALLRLDHYKNSADELFILLQSIEFERDIYMNDCREAKMGEGELESKLDVQLSEIVKLEDENFHVLVELNSAKEELLHKEVELVESRNTKIEVMKEMELLEIALNVQKERTDELLGHVEELNETILYLQCAMLEASKENDVVSSEKQIALELATKVLDDIREEMELATSQVKNLEGQVSDKSLLIESLQLELQQANDDRDLAEKATADAINDISRLISDVDLLMTGNTKKDGEIIALEMELSQLRLELKIANTEGDRLRCDVDTITSRCEKLTSEANEFFEKDSEAQIEIALLKSEVHRGRSKMAAAEASEERAKREKSALELCIQQLALQAENAKNQLQTFKDLAHNLDQERQNSEVVETNEALKEDHQTNASITMTVEDYETLMKKADQTESENEALKREMEMTAVRVGELRARAEQAAWRAEVAEKAKSLLEEERRKWRVQEEKRKVAFEALRQESMSIKKNLKKHPDPPKSYQPLGKILKMKF